MFLVQAETSSLTRNTVEWKSQLEPRAQCDMLYVASDLMPHIQWPHLLVRNIVRLGQAGPNKLCSVCQKMKFSFTEKFVGEVHADL